MDCKSFKETIEKAKNIIIISHVNPDGDTLGTMCALYRILKNNFNILPDMVYNGIIPEIYQFLPSINEAKKPSDVKEKIYDIAIAVDIAQKTEWVIRSRFLKKPVSESILTTTKQTTATVISIL